VRSPELHGTDLLPDLAPALLPIPWAQRQPRPGALHARRTRQRRPFLIGMAGMSAAAVVQFGIVRPNVEMLLVERAENALGAHGYELAVTVAGRDLSVHGELPDGATPDDVRAALAGISGVRVVQVDHLTSAGGHPAGAAPGALNP